jgi:citrate lyase subunit beta / citryl-CoA lyase
MVGPIARSYLFVPASRPARFDKAFSAGADAVIVDLEDAVPDAEKVQARRALANWLSPVKRVLVRINNAESDWFADDLDLCRVAGVEGVVLPKAERPEQVARVVEQIGLGKFVIPLLETAKGVFDAVAIARAPQVQRLAFGSIDFQVDLGIRGEHEELLYFRSHIVLASRLAGLQPPIDGVTTVLDDPKQLREEAQRARRLGFGAKLCIHPKQLALVNECFGPSADEIAWAKRVLDAADAAKGAAVALDGKMVDRPVILKAQEILASAGLR